MAQKITTDINMMGMSKNLICVDTTKGVGERTDVRPRTKSKLKIFDPTILPMAKSGSCLLFATIEVTISGNDVPTATTVKPIKASDNSKSLAKYSEDSTTHLEPIANIVMPKMVKNALMKSFLLETTSWEILSSLSKFFCA